MSITIVILALVAVFVGLRLYSVLGQRTGHEQQPLPPRAVEADRQPMQVARTPRDTPPEVVPEQPANAAAQAGVRALVSADPAFDAARFLDGAKGAYRQTLEAFWAGDEAALAKLVDQPAREAFVEAIRQRASDGHVVENRLVRIDTAAIEDARVLDGKAFVTVRFDADVAALTRDADGTVVAGSLTDAVPTHDLWTFSRQVRASDPNWLLVETDDAA